MCVDCVARRQLARDALYRAKVGEAVGHVVKGAAEMAGLKRKTGRQELEKKQRAAKADPTEETNETN